MPVPAVSEHTRSSAFKCTPRLGRACGLFSGAHGLGQWQQRYRPEQSGLGAWRGEAAGLAQVQAGRVCPGKPEQPQPCWQSRVLPAQMLGGGPGCHVPSASGGHLADVCPSSGFNEAQEGLHALPDHPWPVCQSPPLSAPTLLGKPPSSSSSLGACPCPPPACSQPRSAVVLTLPMGSRRAPAGIPDPAESSLVWLFPGEMRVPGQIALKVL